MAISGLCIGWVRVMCSLRYMIIWVDPNTIYLINQVNPVNSNMTCLTKLVTHVIHQPAKLLDLNPRLYINFDSFLSIFDGKQ